MGRKLYLIVTAGGHGTRMGADVPKQFLPLGEGNILQATITVFTRTFPDIRVITVLPEEHISYWKEYCLKNGFTVPQTLVKGGFTRFHSVKAALEKVPDGAMVAIHDGVRPFVTPGLLRAMRDKMDSGCRALIPCMPVTDTLKVLRKTADGSLEPVPGAVADRSVIYGIQTPQFFLSEDIKSAYSAPYDTSFTDDSSVAQAKNIPLSYCEGERYNIKITTKEDLIFARVFYPERNS